MVWRMNQFSANYIEIQKNSLFRIFNWYTIELNVSVNVIDQFEWLKSSFLFVYLKSQINTLAWYLGSLKCCQNIGMCCMLYDFNWEKKGEGVRDTYMFACWKCENFLGTRDALLRSLAVTKKKSTIKLRVNTTLDSIWFDSMAMK